VTVDNLEDVVRTVWMDSQVTMVFQEWTACQVYRETKEISVYPAELAHLDHAATTVNKEHQVCPDVVVPKVKRESRALFLAHKESLVYQVLTESTDQLVNPVQTVM